MAQSTFVSGAQDHARRLARFECFLPTGCTEAPTVAGFQASKAEFRHRCRKIVAARFGKLEKRGGHDGADRVATDVLSPSVAAAVSKKSRHGFYRADIKPVTEHVTGCAPPTASITAVVPPHACLHYRCRPSAAVLACGRRALGPGRSRSYLRACRAPHRNRVARGKGQLERLIKLLVALCAIAFFAASAHGPIDD